MTIRREILRCEGISKYFHEPQTFKVLNEVALTAYTGEFMTLIGKSGSGKSTLLYCLSTMDTSYEGQLFIHGQKVTGRSTDALAALRNEHIGFVFQFHYLLPEFTCLQNVMLPAMRLGRYSQEEIEARAYERLTELGLSAQALKPASKLSGGQQQRVAIARAIINDPDILMCDEPTGNLDSKNSEMVVEVFNRLKEERGQTIIAVTHDNDIARRSDRIVELADGRIVRDVALSLT